MIELLPPLTLRPLVTWRRQRNPCLFTIRARAVFVTSMTYAYERVEDAPCCVSNCIDPGVHTVFVTFGPGTSTDPDSAAFIVRACKRHAEKMRAEASRVLYPWRYRLIDWVRARRRK